MPRRSPRAALTLLALLVAQLTGACGGSDPKEVGDLERQRDELLAKTVPKQEYWAEVTRKGNALRELRGLQGGVADLEQRAAQANQGAKELEPQLLETTQINQRIVEQTNELHEKLAQLLDEIAKLEDFIGQEQQSPAPAP